METGEKSFPLDEVPGLKEVSSALQLSSKTKLSALYRFDNALPVVGTDPDQTDVTTLYHVLADDEALSYNVATGTNKTTVHVSYSIVHDQQSRMVYMFSTGKFVAASRGHSLSL